MTATSLEGVRQRARLEVPDAHGAGAGAGDQQPRGLAKGHSAERLLEKKRPQVSKGVSSKTAMAAYTHTKHTLSAGDASLGLAGRVASSEPLWCESDTMPSSPTQART